MTGAAGTDQLAAILAAAQARRNAGQWEHAARLFRRAELLAPGAPDIKHNLALAYYAKGEVHQAQGFAERAVRIAPSLWQSHALLARIHRATDIEAADAAWRNVLRHDPGNGTALLGLADLAMNEFGDAAGALALVEPLRQQPAHAADAELTGLMASLYIGSDDARALTARLVAFSGDHLRIARAPSRAPRAGRRRIGLISPLFSASPVYYLTYSTWAAVAREHDLILFSRATRRDWASDALQNIATKWIEAAHLEAETLAEQIAGEEIDILFDLGGWSDVVGLKALSAKPAARMYKWVGGQSATTGLEMFDGWIGDGWQSPEDSQPLYAEPLLNMAGGYVDYSPPPALRGLMGVAKQGVALVGNPAKIGEGTIAAWPSGVERVTLIDRRYARPRTLNRVRELLARAGIKVEQVIAPRGQDAYLRALAGCEAIINTQPYSAGLTAIEAYALGVRFLSGPAAGPLFCSRHHLSHRRTSGRNPALAAQILRLIAQ
jgi:protein O-GlcNAc transferase